MAPSPPRSIDVRVWVTRPHIAVLEFPMSPNTSALLLEGEQGVYYRWQSLIIAQVSEGHDTTYKRTTHIRKGLISTVFNGFLRVDGDSINVWLHVLLKSTFDVFHADRKTNSIFCMTESISWQCSVFNGKMRCVQVLFLPAPVAVGRSSSPT